MSESSNINLVSCVHDNDIAMKLPSCVNDLRTPLPPVYKDPCGNIGFERRDLVRVVSKFLDDMGYKKAAQELENESGIKCQSSHVSDILNAIVQGDWTLAIEQVHKVKLNTDASLVELLILERKFAEYLECDNIDAALECLQLELAPKAPEDDNAKRLRFLSTCLICPDNAELQKQLQRVGAHSASRLELAKSVKASIASSELIPTGMLENFIVDSLKSQSELQRSSKKSRPHESSTSMPTRLSRSPWKSSEKSLFRSPGFNGSDVRIYSLFGESAKGDNDDEIPTNLHPDPPTTCLWTLEGHDKEEVWDLSISNNSQFMASGGKDGSIKIWMFSKNPGEPPNHLMTFRPRDEDCTMAKKTEEDANSVRRKEDHGHRPFNLVWSHDSKFLLSCSEECNKIFLWSISDIDPNENSIEDSPQINLIPPQVIYSHHSGREATCCVWLPDVNKQRAFMSGGSDGELLICGFNGTILAALSTCVGNDKSKGGKMSSTSKRGGSKTASFLPPEEDRWLGNEIRGITILNQHINKINGLRFMVSFSDNYLLLCEIKTKENFDTSTLNTSQEYPENAVPSNCQLNIRIINKVLLEDTIISFGHVCSFVHPNADSISEMDNCHFQFQSLESSASMGGVHTVDESNNANVSFTSGMCTTSRRNSSSSSSSANNARHTVYVPMLIEEGIIKFLEIKGNSLKVSTSELSGVIQYRFSLRASMAKYWMGTSSNSNPDVYNGAIIACGTENCIIYIWSFDEGKSDDFSDADDNIKMFDKEDIKRLKRARLLGHIGPINCVVWHPHYPGYLLSASDDGTICGWGPESMKLVENGEGM